MASDNKDKTPIPVLRTYEGDVHHVAQAKGGEDLRKILVREMEEKKKAQEEYRQKIRDLMKESLVLKDRQRGFLRGSQKKVDDSGEAVAHNFNRQQIDDTISGALSYMQVGDVSPQAEQKEGADAVSLEKEEHTSTQEPPEAMKEGVPEKEMPPQSIPHDIPDQHVSREDFGAGAVEGPPEVDPSDEIVGVAKEEPQQRGILDRLRRGKQKPISEERRGELQQKQKEIVEKESIRKAWKDFSEKKESLRQLGLEARDVRTYNTKEIVNPLLKKQNIIAVAFVAIVLTLTVFVVASVSFNGDEQPVIAVPGASAFMSDILVSDDVLPVDVARLPDDWGSIARKRSRDNVVTKYIPYRSQEEEQVQIDLSEFFQVFSVSPPRGLRNAFGDSYFVGNYTDNGAAHGILIIPVRNYDDALVWILNWEKQIVSALQEVFPTMVYAANPDNVTVQSVVVDNKDVRIVKHAQSSDVLYYFFDRSTLIFIVGDQSLVGKINERIRQLHTRGL